MPLEQFNNDTSNFPEKSSKLKFLIIAVFVLIFGVLTIPLTKYFKGALVGNLVKTPEQCLDLMDGVISKNSFDDGRVVASDEMQKDEPKTWKTMVVLLRDVNLKIDDPNHSGDDYLDSKLSQDEATYFCTKFKEFKNNVEKDTPLKLKVVKLVDYRKRVSKIAKAESQSVVDNKATTTLDFKISSEQLPFNKKTSSLYFEPGSVDSYFVVYDNEEFVNVLYKSAPDKKLHAAASTYSPSSFTNGAIAIFVQAKENWIQKDYDLVHALTHEFTHAITSALEEHNIKIFDLHGYSDNYEKGELSKGVPSQNWVYEEHKTNINGGKKTSYQIEDEFKNYIFKSILDSNNYWEKALIRDKGENLAKKIFRSGKSLGEVYEERISPNIIEVPVFRKDQNQYTVAFTTQGIENKKFGYLVKQKEANSILDTKSEYKLIKEVKPEWIIEEFSGDHGSDAKIHKDFPNLPHYDEPHQHFVLNIPFEVGKFIKIWAFSEGKFVNPETSAELY